MTIHEVLPRRARLLLIGGAEDPDESHMAILPHLVKAAGGTSARVVVCSSPSEEAGEKADTYVALFRKLGVKEAIPAPITERGPADSREMVDVMRRATAVFFTGGDQLRLTWLIAGTEMCEVIRERLYRDGLVVAGTSAGAAALSSVMIIGGREGGTVRRRDVELTPGFGYWRETVVDTHFDQRGRVNRLLTIAAQNPQVLGVGIDENTAIDVVLGRAFTVLGEGAVIVFNGRVTHTSAPAASADDSLAVTDATVHVLPRGYGFDLASGRPILPDGTRVPRHMPAQ